MSTGAHSLRFIGAVDRPGLYTGAHNLRLIGAVDRTGLYTVEIVYILSA